jgi:Tol biopolymer transport system component
MIRRKYLGSAFVFGALLVFAIIAIRAALRWQFGASVKERPAMAGRLVFAKEGRLAEVRPDGRGFQWLTPALPLEGGDQLNPDGFRLSCDGQRIAYLRHDFQAKVHKLYVQDLNADEAPTEVMCTANWVSNTLCWSTDGTQLLVIEALAPGDYQHWLVDVRTNAKTEMKIPKGSLVIDWFDNGRWILSLSRIITPDHDANSKPQFQLLLRRSDGSIVRQLTNLDQTGDLGRFAPDGGRLLFLAHSYSNDTGGIYVLDLPDGKPRKVGPDLKKDGLTRACWSPDGKWIAHTWRAGKDAEANDLTAEAFLQLVDANGQNPMTLLRERTKEPAASRILQPFNLATLWGIDWR